MDGCPFAVSFWEVTGLLLASCLYACGLEFVERRWGVVSDYTWLTVVAGVLYTLGVLALVDWRAAGSALIAFAAAGLPIIFRSLVNDIRQRNATRRAIEWREDD